MKSYLAVILAVTACILSGCRTMSPPKTSDNDAIMRGEKALVLIRTNANVSGEPVDTFIWFTFKIANISQGEPVYSADRAAPSPETRQAGWKYLLLQPGETYYLQPGLSFNPLPSGGWFRIPQNSRLVYIGSLSTQCEGSLGLWGDPVSARSCSPLSIIDETESAKEIARNLFPTYGELSTSLMRPWPITSDIWRTNPELPLTLDVATAEKVTAPGWYEKSFEKSWFFANPGGGGGPVGLLLIAAELAYLPVGLAIGAAGGAHSESKWQPCIDRLSEGIRNKDYVYRTETAIASALKSEGVNYIDKVSEISVNDDEINSMPKLALKAEINKVALTECQEDWTFYINTSFHISLKKHDGDYYLYDQVYSISDRKNIYHYPYITPINVSLQCRTIEDYCGADGLAIVNEQMTDTLNAAAKQIANDLNLQRSVK